MPNFPPQLSDFLLWIRQIMEIPTEALPDDSPSLQWAFNYATEWVPPSHEFMGVATIYTSCLFNLGGSLLVQNAPDVEGSCFFQDARTAYGIGGGVRAGVLGSGSDESTSESMIVGEAMSNLSLADLQLLQDPYGVRALALLQELGPLWEMV